MGIMYVHGGEEGEVLAGPVFVSGDVQVMIYGTPHTGIMTGLDKVVYLLCFTKRVGSVCKVTPSR